MTETILSTPSPSLSRLARFGLGLGFKSNGGSPSSRAEDQNDDDWYIPYNGPHDKSRDKGKERERNSGWGDLLDVPDDSGPFAVSKRSSELIIDHNAQSSGIDYDERRGRTRSRAFSGSSRYTTTTGGDRWSFVSSSQPVSSNSRFGSRGKKSGVPSFLNLDISGTGIGESPVPVQRMNGSSINLPSIADSTNANRGSLASFWTFGQSSVKRSPTASVAQNNAAEHWPRPSTSTQHTTNSRRDRAATVGASERENDYLPKHAADIFSSSQKTTFNDATPYSQRRQAQDLQDDEPIASTSKTPQSYVHHAPHPYAVAFPSYAHDEERPENRPQQAIKSKAGPTPSVTITTPYTHPQKKIPLHLQEPKPNSLRSSISAPNLRAMSTRHADTPKPPSSRSPNWMDKWFSAETCFDAFVFPRPRFRVHPAHALSSPPSPLPGSSPTSSNPIGSNRLLRPASTRTLKKKTSRLGFFLQGHKAARDSPSSLVISNPQLIETTTALRIERPPRPKSFAMDDLALISPVPSLMRVIREGDTLEKERADWNNLATHSFQNKRSRSLSRTRLKSLVNHNMQQIAMDKERRTLELAESFNLLANRAFHGHQGKKPSISEPPSIATSTGGTASRNGTVNGGGTMSSSDHSRKSSNVSQPRGGRGHAHKESWGKTAIKTAKATVNAAGICVFPDDVSSAPADERSTAIESALIRDDTQVINLGERELERQKNKEEHDVGVVLISPQPAVLYTGSAPRAVERTPSPSTETHDAHVVGIAVSTPSATVEVENPISLPDHPYANGGILSYEVPTPQRTDYAGPHPVHVQLTDLSLREGQANDVSLRHRLPPRPQPLGLTVAVNNHPYASAGAQHLSPSHLPLHSARSNDRMYAQLSSGEIREIKPDEFEYSPFIAKPDQFQYFQSHRSSSLGIEEVLNVAFRHNQDDGVEERTDPSNDLHPYQTSIPSSEVLQRIPSNPSDRAKLSSVHPQLKLPVDQQLSPGQSSSSSPYREATSQDSSPKGSPGIFKVADDFDKYSDLFYNPAKHSDNALNRRTPSSSLDVNMSLSPSPDRNGSVSSKHSGGLRNLTRQLSTEFGIIQENLVSSPLEESSSSLVWGRRFGGTRGERPDHGPDPNLILPRISSETAGTAYPLRLPTSQLHDSQPSLLIPEDVSVSQRSSLIEENPDFDDETQDNTVVYRVGEVPALSTPNPVNGSPHRFSRQALYVDSDPGSLSPRGSYNINNGDTPQRQHNSTILSPFTPLYSASDATRASYVTTTSSTSHISRLSDFPVPPTSEVMSSPISRPHFSNHYILSPTDGHGTVSGRI